MKLLKMLFLLLIICQILSCTDSILLDEAESLQQTNELSKNLNFPTTDISKYRLADLDGNGRNDVFHIDSMGHWFVSWNGTSVWDDINSGVIAIEDIRFGMFNNDDETDVFYIDSTGAWNVVYGGTSHYVQLRAPDPNYNITINDIMLGYFNEDNITDVFYINNSGHWLVSWGGTSNWSAPINSWSGMSIDNFRICDFDGNGLSDIFYIDPNGVWKVSTDAINRLTTINSGSVSINDVRFGKFDGDDKTDVFYIGNNGSWNVVYDGTSHYEQINASSFLTIDDVLLGDLSGNNRTDIFYMDTNGYWYSSVDGTEHGELLRYPTHVIFFSHLFPEMDSLTHYIAAPWTSCIPQTVYPSLPSYRDVGPQVYAGHLYVDDDVAAGLGINALELAQGQNLHYLDYNDYYNYYHSIYNQGYPSIAIEEFNGGLVSPDYDYARALAVGIRLMKLDHPEVSFTLMNAGPVWLYGGFQEAYTYSDLILMECYTDATTTFANDLLIYRANVELLEITKKSIIMLGIADYYQLSDPNFDNYANTDEILETQIKWCSENLNEYAGIAIWGQGASESMLLEANRLIKQYFPIPQ